MRTALRLAVVLAVSSGIIVGFGRDARAQEEGEESAVFAANRGLKLDLGPTLLLPMRDNGPYGGGVALDGRYGFRAGPTVLAPGGRVAGYLISSRGVAVGMPTFRVTVPAGPLAPFVLGGVGVGWMSGPSERGAAIMGGGGLMIHFARLVAVGAEVTYQEITQTEFKAVTVGPSFMIGGV